MDFFRVLGFGFFFLFFLKPHAVQKQTTTTTTTTTDDRRGVDLCRYFLRTEIFLSFFGNIIISSTHHINKRKRSNAVLFLVSASSSSSSSSLDGALFVFSFSASGIIEEMCSGSNGCFVERSN